MPFKHLAVVSLAALTAACAIQPPYHPATSNRSTGYSDQRLTDTRYRVTFTGGQSTRRSDVEDFLLLRAAEVTKNAGYTWFEFDSREIERDTYRDTFAGYPGWGPGWRGGFGWYWRNWAYDPWDPYWGMNSFPVTRYEASAEIVLLTPGEAKSHEHALNADEVIAHLGPKAEPPPR